MFVWMGDKPSKPLKQHLRRIAGEGVGYDGGDYPEGMVANAVSSIGQHGEACPAIVIHALMAKNPLGGLCQFLPMRQPAWRLPTAPTGKRKTPPGRCESNAQ